MKRSTLITIFFVFFLFLIVFTTSVSASPYPYWVEHDENGNALQYVWTKVNLTANGNLTLYVYKQAGYSPNGDAVFDFFDDFESGSLNTSKWTIATGGASVILNGSTYVAKTTTPSNTVDGAISTVPSFSDIIVDVDHAFVGNVNDGKARWQLRFRAQDYGDAYEISYQYPSTSFQLDKISGGSYTTITNSQSIDLTYDYKWHHLQLILDGSSIKFLFDGTTMVSTTDTTYASGTVMIGGWAQDTDYWDNFRIRKYTPTPPTVTVTDEGTYYKVQIHNNEATSLTDYQVGIPVSSLGVTSENESLYIGDQPLSMGNQSVYPTPFYVGTNVTQQFDLVNNTNNQTIYLTATDENTSTLLYNESFIVYSNESNATFKQNIVIPVSLAHHTIYFTTSSSIAGTLDSQEYTVSDTPPTAPTSLTLNTPLYVNSTIIADASGSTDVDGDNLTYYYLFEDEAETILQNWSTSNNYTIPVSEAHKKIIVYAKAYDGFNYSSTISTSFTVANTAPTATANFSDMVVDTVTPQTIHISDLDNDSNFTIYLYNPDGTLNQKYSVDSQDPTINVTIPAETAYLGNQTLNCTVEDQYGGTYHFSIPVFVYGANVTVVFSDENGNPINLSAISYFSQDDVNSTPFYTSTPQHYLLKYLPTWYKVVIQNATMLKEFVVGPGTYTLHAYLINPFTTQYVVEPIQVVDVTNQPIYILNTKGFVTWSQLQDSLGKIYPYMELGQTYSIALKENGQLVTFGQITVLSNPLVVLYSKSISLPKLQKSLFQDVQVNYGFTGSGSIYLNYSDASESTTKLIEYLYYLNTSNSTNQYVLFANQTYLNENTISSYFVVPSNVDSNSTQFKVEFQIWNKYGHNEIVKYFTRTNKIFLGVNAIAIGFFVFLGLLMLIGAFPVMFESIGLIIGGLALVLLSMLNLLPFMSPIVATSIGGFYTILGFFKMMANSGVTKQ